MKAARESKALFLSDPVVDYFSGDVGEAEIASLETISQKLVVHPEKLEHGGVEVVRMDRVLLHSPSDLVGPTVNLSTLDSSTGEQHGIAGRMVIAASYVFCVPTPVFPSGVRPNSDPQTTIVESRRPRSFKSFIRAAIGWSTAPAL